MPSTQLMPFDLSQPDIWRHEKFAEMLLRSIQREGFDADVRSAVKQALMETVVGGYGELKKTLLRAKESFSVKTSKDIDALLARWDDVIARNKDCYVGRVPEETRIIQWPNNPRVKERNPEHYFSIYEDFFYRSATRFITEATPIGSVGSCFAKRIAHQLQAWRYNYIIEEDDLPEGFPLENMPKSQYRMAPARVGTLLNAGSIRQMMERAFGDWEPEMFVFKSGSHYRDPFRYTSALYDSADKFHDDYVKHTESLRRALLKCKVFIITLGLTEAWQFAHSGDYLSLDPQLLDPLLVRQKNMTAQDNLEQLDRILFLYKKAVPDIKIILSVSPVGLNKTYSQKNHVVAATCYSKSVLRVVAEEFSSRQPECVTYFPSYEMVLYGTKNAWEPDTRHVSAEAVGRVMGLFQKMFLIDQEPLPLISQF